MFCRLEKSIFLVQSSICLISTSPAIICSEGGQRRDDGGVGCLFSNYAVWNNHARDISKSDLLSRRCRAQERRHWLDQLSSSYFSLCLGYGCPCCHQQQQHRLLFQQL